MANGDAGCHNTFVVGATNAVALAASAGLQPSLAEAEAAQPLQQRRGSSCYAVADYGAPLPTAVDPSRKDRPASVLQRLGGPGGLGLGYATGAPLASPISAVDRGSLSVLSSGGASARPLSLSLPNAPAAVSSRFGSSLSSAPLRRGAQGFSSAALQRQQARHRRLQREVSRWEELSGNVSRAWRWVPRSL